MSYVVQTFGEKNLYQNISKLCLVSKQGRHPSLKNLTKRCRDMNFDIYTCFIDYCKVPNSVNLSDNTVILISSMKELQIFLKRTIQHSTEFVLQVNVSKTKTMVFSVIPRYVKCVQIEKYLGKRF